MGSPVNIGSMNVLIEGDYSQLSEDLAKAQDIAKQSAADIAKGFTDTAASANTLGERVQVLIDQGYTLATALAAIQEQDIAATLNKAGTAAEQAAEQLKLFDDATQVPYADAAGQLNLFATELEPLANNAKAAADALHQTAQSEQEVQQSAQGATSGLSGLNISLGDFIKGGLALAGIHLSFQGIKAAIEEALSAFASLERATESMTALMGSAKLAEDEIANLRTLAQDDALAFPSLLAAAQKMTAFGLSTKETNALLEDAANASRATGNSFDAVVNSLNRMVESGVVSNRTLVQVGLTSRDLAGVMGVATGEVSKLFKALDQTAQFDIVNAAMQKFAGLAKETADDTTGTWQKLSNAARQEFTRVGAEIAGATPAFQSFATGAIHALGSVADFFINFVSTIATKGGDLVNGFKNILAGMGVTFDNIGQKEKQAADSNKQYEQSIGTLTIQARQLFSGFPDYQAQLTALNNALNQGAKDPSSYKTALLQLEGQFKSLHPEIGATTTATLTYTQEVAKLKKELADNVITQDTYNRKLAELEKAHGAAANSTKALHAEFKEISQSYKDMGKAMDVARTSMASLLDFTSSLEGTTQTYIGTLKEQATAFQTFITQSADLAAGFGSAAKTIITDQNNLVKSANDNATAWNQLARTWNTLDAEALEKLGIDTDTLQKGMDVLKSSLNAAGMSADDLKVKLIPIGDTVTVISGSVAKLKTVGDDFDKTIDSLNKQLGDLGVNVGFANAGVTAASSAMGGASISAKAAADGIKVYDGAINSMVSDSDTAIETTDNLGTAAKSAADAFKGMTVQTGGVVTGLKDIQLAADGVYEVFRGKVTPAMKEALKAGTDLSGITPVVLSLADAWSAANSGIKTATDSMTEFGTVGEKVLSGLVAQLKAMNDAFNQWANSVGSFSGNLGQNAQAGSIKNLANPYWGLDPAGIGALLQQNLSNFGGSIFNDFSGAHFFAAAQEQLAQAAFDYWFGQQSPSGQPTTSTTAATLSTISGIANAANNQTPAGSALDAIQRFFQSQGVDLSQVTESVNNLTPAVTALTNTLATTNTTFAGATSSLASLTPALVSTAAAVTAAAQQQAAAFATLAQAVTPPAAPTAPYSPPSVYQRSAGIATSGGFGYGGGMMVNNMTIQTTPDIANLLNQLMVQIQRQGVRP